MKIASICDIHIQGGPESDEAKALMRAAGHICMDPEITHLLVGGDVYERDSTPEQRLVFKRFLEGCGPIKKVIIRGNHDRAKDLIVFHDPSNGVIVSERPETIELGKLVVHTLPHFNAAALALEMQSRGELEQTGTDLFGSILENFKQQINSGDGKVHFMLGHGVISGAKLDSGRIPMENGIHVPLVQLLALGCPVVFGHYHAAQEVAPWVWYAGSITRQTFGEAKDDKGFLIWEEQNGLFLPKPEFVSLKPRTMITVNAEFRDGVFYHNGEVLDPSILDAPGADIRFQYSVAQKDISFVDLGTVLPKGVTIKVERTVETEAVVRNEAIAESQSVEDDLAIWMKSRGMSDQEIATHLDEYRWVVSQNTENEAAA